MTLPAKRVVVVGATGGIGTAVVERLLAERAKVVALDVPGSSDPVPAGALFLDTCDLLSDSTVESSMIAAADYLGGIDAVVNAAGVTARGDVSHTTVDEWDRVLNINCRGSFLLAKHSFPFLKEGISPKLVIVASQLGLVGAPKAAAYCASKGAVIQLVRALAIDWAQDGIVVNAVCPGPTETPMLDEHFRSSEDPARERLQFERAMLTGRLVTPTEVAAVLTFLAVADIGSMTGATIVVDGGYTVT